MLAAITLKRLSAAPNAALRLRLVRKPRLAATAPSARIAIVQHAARRLSNQGRIVYYRLKILFRRGPISFFVPL